MLSRFTEPGRFAPMLDELPDDPRAIAAVARAQTIHHNLLAYFGVVGELRRVWPPRFDAVLGALADTPPRTLSIERPPDRRILGACVLESHFIAGLLRHRGHRVRIRVGYFRNIRENQEHVVAFWADVARAKGVEALEAFNAYSQRQNDLDHRIEHWICELPDGDTLLDANTDFLRAHSGLEVDAALPRRYFEHAHEGWRAIRSGDCDPDRYREDEQDGRSHARSQLLWDLFSLLNHDAAGLGDLTGGDYAFVKRQTYDETSPGELAALDELASLLAEQRFEELADFYKVRPELRLEGAERDRHSLVFEG